MGIIHIWYFIAEVYPLGNLYETGVLPKHIQINEKQVLIP